MVQVRGVNSGRKGSKTCRIRSGGGMIFGLAVEMDGHGGPSSSRANGLKWFGWEKCADIDVQSRAERLSGKPRRFRPWILKWCDRPFLVRGQSSRHPPDRADPHPRGARFRKCPVVLCRRSRPSHARRRSTTRRLGSFTKPSEPPGRRTTSNRNGSPRAASHSLAVAFSYFSSPSTTSSRGNRTRSSSCQSTSDAALPSSAEAAVTPPRPAPPRPGAAPSCPRPGVASAR